MIFYFHFTIEEFAKLLQILFVNFIEIQIWRHFYMDNERDWYYLMRVLIQLCDCFRALCLTNLYLFFFLNVGILISAPFKQNKSSDIKENSIIKYIRHKANLIKQK